MQKYGTIIISKLQFLSIKNNIERGFLSMAKIKVSTVIEIISGLASLPLMVLNISFIFELISLFTEPVPDDAGSQLGKGLLLVFLIIFTLIMDAVAMVRWFIYTHRSTKRRGILKTLLIQLPFFIVFTAVFVMLYSLANENIDFINSLWVSLLGGLGFSFIFADVDLYKTFFRILFKKKTVTDVIDDSIKNDGE